MTQNEENTPKTPIKPPLPKRLRDRLEATLEENYSSLPDGIMVEQTQLLDSAFRHLLGSGLQYGGTALFLAAFKAQNQYRMTVKALEPFDSPRGGGRKT